MERLNSEKILLHFQSIHPDKIVLSEADIGEDFSHHYNIFIFEDMNELYEYLRGHQVRKNWKWVDREYYERECESEELWTKEEAIVDLSRNDYIDIITFKTFGYRLKFAKQTVFQELKEYFQRGTPY